MWGGARYSKREETFNLGEITKAGQKTALDGRMPPGRLCCYYVGERVAELQRGPIREQGMEDGVGEGPRRDNPPRMFSLQRAGERDGALADVTQH